eukprot:CAMPEP_0194049056 /NCGR_PEP_ID=MMETSP0009_2-20130614/29529_1 /TAXON_ID=210454 /ORGANISM="Grammatophora oceanica, Strain CCMP 410" /LENGTH=84 /DNA_ID=CAMNT_0038695115 /DNA_START=230 /DNA_END=484 /DNA_ORIENTATION=+
MGGKNNARLSKLVINKVKSAVGHRRNGSSGLDCSISSSGGGSGRHSPHRSLNESDFALPLAEMQGLAKKSSSSSGNVKASVAKR